MRTISFEQLRVLARTPDEKVIVNKDTRLGSLSLVSINDLRQQLKDNDDENWYQREMQYDDDETLLCCLVNYKIELKKGE